MKAVDPKVRSASAWINRKVPYVLTKIEFESLKGVMRNVQFFEGYTLRVFETSYEFFVDAAKEGARCTLGFADSYITGSTSN